MVVEGILEVRENKRERKETVNFKTIIYIGEGGERKREPVSRRNARSDPRGTIYRLKFPFGWFRARRYTRWRSLSSRNAHLDQSTSAFMLYVERLRFR